MKLALLLLLCSPQLCSSGSTETKDNDVKVKCRDENNKEVDWYILYKAPDGQTYTYISTNGEEKTNKLIGASDGVLAHTLSPMFQKPLPNDLLFLSYSDQPPSGDTVKDVYGHSKGVVLGDSKTKSALWLTHSTPKFPQKKDAKGFWPPNGKINGQTFMCVSLSLEQLKDIGTHLQHIRAYTFDKPANLPSGFPKEILDAANNKGPDPHFLSLKIGNTAFRVVAKGLGQETRDGDLYVHLSREFRSDIDAKTWCQQNNDMDYCEPNQYKVKNVLNVKIGKTDWPWTKDHSKWAVTMDNNVHWTCVADVNRADSQYLRPGGALCIQSEGVTKIFKGFVNVGQPCNRKRPRCDSSNEVEKLAESLQEMDLDQHDDL